MYHTDIWERKKHVTVVLSATADGTMLPPMLIFKGKTDKTIKKLRIPEGFIVKTQEKSWTYDVQSKLVENKSEILMTPPGCTSKCQPMDVCINKLFKAIL